jgi:phage tail sheath protein FI
MAFRVSPGVSIKEIDLTTIVPNIATTPGAYAGYYYWGPADEIVTVSSEKELAAIFGKPDSNNYVDFFTPANFLQYGNNIQVVRALGGTAANSTTTLAGFCAANLDIHNETEYAGNSYGTASSTVLFAGKYPGVLGNSLQVVVVAGTGVTAFPATNSAIVFGGTSLGFSAGTSSTAWHFAKGDTIQFSDGTAAVLDTVYDGVTALAGASAFGLISGEYVGVTAASVVTVNLQSGLPKAQALGATFTVKSVYTNYVNTIATTTNYAASVGGSGDAISVLVLDKDGKWTGVAGTLLEKFEGVSRASDARNTDGSSNYYKQVIGDKSNYIYALSADLSANTSYISTKTDWTLPSAISGARIVNRGGVISMGLTGGLDGVPTDAERWSTGWSYFADAATVDVSLLPLGNASATLSKLIVSGICEKRLDCIAFLSPQSTDVVSKLPYEALSAVKTYRSDTLNINSSYAVLDSGWKYQLDTYNNVVRAMPLNADIAGLVARTEYTNEAWFSPAGFNRGQIKNVVKLAYNPSTEAHRDELYTRQINPVVSFPGDGTILYGDKTMQSKPSAFDRINVRRLFIVLEKAIATASKFFLFEQNDGFTRAQFKNLVVPFLKTVQQRRGITDFKVVCDDTNNTGEVIDRNEFVADIFVKPTRSINFIQLNFIATKTGVNFSEVGG